MLGEEARASDIINIARHILQSNVMYKVIDVCGMYVLQVESRARELTTHNALSEFIYLNETEAQ